MYAAIISAALGAIVLHFIYQKLTAGPNISHLPIINPKPKSWFSSDKAHKDQFMSSAYELMLEGIKKVDLPPPGRESMFSDLGLIDTPHSTMASLSDSPPTRAKRLFCPRTSLMPSRATRA